MMTGSAKCTSPSTATRQTMLNDVARITTTNVAWVPDSLADRCYQCQNFFSLVLRRHHCRRCGNVFCDSCSSERMPLVSAGFFTPVRVCGKCYTATKRAHIRRGDCLTSAPIATTNSMNQLNPLSLDNEKNNSKDSTSINERKQFGSSSSSFSSSDEMQCSTGIVTLSGEFLILRSPSVLLRSSRSRQTIGTLYLTNYRVVFTSSNLGNTTCSDELLPIDYHAIPLMCIDKVKRKEIPDQDTGIIEIISKDIRKIDFYFEGLVEKQTFSSFERTYVTLRQYAFGDSGGSAIKFAKVSQERYDHIEDGWEIYQPLVEFDRLGIHLANNWRISRININYKYCPSYPALIAVPVKVTDETLHQASTFRAKSRIPVLSWRDKKSGATICRCSQPFVGLGQKQSASDIRLVQAIADVNPSSNKLIIVDARPWRNAVAQKTMGRAGYEQTSHYESSNIELPFETNFIDLNRNTNNNSNSSSLFLSKDLKDLKECKLVFMGIENIHTMRKSLMKLEEICLSKSSSKWLDQLSSTHWLEHISVILEAARSVVKYIKQDKASILVHCSDGWDRTAQITALSLLLLDPFYRTIVGFEILIEKEWCSFGHKFSDRCGHGASNQSNEESPVFLQFIECVWQLIEQFPCSFEFNERFLITILNHLYSCRFGTFLYNTEKERKIEESKNPTISLWTYIHSEKKSYFTNPFYEPQAFSRKNWRARVEERRECIEHSNCEGIFAMGTNRRHYEEDQVVQQEEKEDGVVLVHTESSTALDEMLAAFGTSKGKKNLVKDDQSQPVLPNRSIQVNNRGDLLSQKSKSYQVNNLTFHNVIEDLDNGLAFPNHIPEGIEILRERSTTPEPSALSPSYTRVFLSPSPEVSAADISEDLESKLLSYPEPINTNDCGDLILECSPDEGDKESINSEESAQDISWLEDENVLLPNCSLRGLQFWSGYFLRWGDRSSKSQSHSSLEKETRFRDIVAQRDCLESLRQEIVQTNIEKAKNSLEEEKKKSILYFCHSTIDQIINESCNIAYVKQLEEHYQEKIKQLEEQLEKQKSRAASAIN